MNDENKIGIAPLKDDDLDGVSGGITKAQAAEAKAQAEADGRTHMLESGNLLCLHNRKYKWARGYTSDPQSFCYTYCFTDIKCYHPNCGKTWASHSGVY